jgi:predicted ester cyclase
MSLEENKAIARRHFDELWARGDLAVAEEIYASVAVGHCGNLPDQHDYPACEQELVRQDRVAFPDGTVTVEDQIAEGDKVLTRWRFRATHTGRCSATRRRAGRSRSPASTSTASSTARSSRSSRNSRLEEMGREFHGPFPRE